MTSVVVIPRFLKTMAAGALGTVWLIHGVIDDSFPPSMRGLEIDEERQVIKVPVWISSDFHCPWTLMARRSLEEAAKQVPEVELEIKWNPIMLHTTLPLAGGTPLKPWMDQHQGVETWEYFTDPDGLYMMRSHMFGIKPNLQPDQLIGSSTNAHRISYKILKTMGHKKQDEVAQLIFRAFLEDGKNITSPWVLSELAAEVGMDKKEALRYLFTDADQDLMEKLCFSARGSDLIKGSPQMNFKCIVEPVNGIQKPDTYADVLDQYRKHLRLELQRNGATLA